MTPGFPEARLVESSHHGLGFLLMIMLLLILGRWDKGWNVCTVYGYRPGVFYRMGTFYFEYGDRERGMQLLRESRLLFDLPRFVSTPKIDGRLDDSVWEGAASIDSFFSHSGDSRTSLQPKVQTRALMGYSDEALYWGMHCSDAHPESLIVLPYGDNSQRNRYQDIVEFFFDRNLDRKTISVIGPCQVE